MPVVGTERIQLCQQDQENLGSDCSTAPMDAGQAPMRDCPSPPIPSSVTLSRVTWVGWRITFSSPAFSCGPLRRNLRKNNVSSSQTTSIVNLRHHQAEVNCGRGSIFGNPFSHDRLGITRDECCDKFVPYFYKKLQDSEFRAKVLALKGKRLGCWCRCLPPCDNPKCKTHRCHLETIVEYLEGLKIVWCLETFGDMYLHDKDMLCM